MANNRHFLVCGWCKKENPEDGPYLTYLGKYFPSSGWSIDEGKLTKINQFLQDHRHYSFGGEEIYYTTENVMSSEDWQHFIKWKDR